MCIYIHTYVYTLPVKIRNMQTSQKTLWASSLILKSAHTCSGAVQNRRQIVFVFMSCSMLCSANVSITTLSYLRHQQL